MKKWTALVLAVLFVTTMAATALAYTPGTYTASAPGFGGNVEVTMTFDEAAITDVAIKGDSETPGIGSNAVEKLPAAIMEAQSAEVDGVAGATMSSSAIKKAAADCIQQASGEEKTVAAANMKDGRYVAYAESFVAGDGLTVTVDINENKIRTIEVDFEHNSDMQIILQAAIDKLIPRMIEHQSVSIDAICGATVSSNAIKRATEDCVVQALVAGGSDPSAIENFYVALPQTGETVELETEVLVVGMGGAGSAAAAAAAQGGAQVLAIDKAGRYGGSTSLTCDVFALNPPRVVAEKNNGQIYQDRQVVLDDWITYCEGDAKQEIVEMYLDASGEMLDWLVYDFNVQFQDAAASWFSTCGFVTCFQWAPSKWNNCDVLYANIGRMIDAVTANGGSYMLETEGYELIYDEAANKVTGVKARNVADGTEYIIKADAVILATGGYMGSPELQLQLLKDDYYPLNGVWKHYGSKQNDGKMWTAAMNIGAGTYNANMSPEVHASSTGSWLTQFPKHYLEGQKSMVADRDAFWTEGDLPMYLGWCSDSLAVNPKGERFCSETGVGMLDPWLAGPEFFSIWSDTQIKKIEAEGFDALNSTIFFGSLTAIPMFTPVPNVDAVLEAAVEAGIMVKGNSVEELAAQLGMAPETLAATVSAYNGYCETGVDEQFGKPAQFLEKVEGETYYAVKMYSYAYGSCGALDINEKFEVLKTDGETVIDGLYAIGTDSMGVLFTEKKPYVTYGGVNNSWGLTSGMLAGRQIAAELAE